MKPRGSSCGSSEEAVLEGKLDDAGGGADCEELDGHDCVEGDGLEVIEDLANGGAEESDLEADGGAEDLVKGGAEDIANGGADRLVSRA